MSTLQDIRKVIKGAGQVDKLVELNLSDISIGKFTTQIKKEIQKCKNLQILILSGCDLQSLDNLPECDLTAIDFTSNKLGDNEVEKLTRYENLGQLILNQNNITKVESIKELSKLQHLQELDLSDNPVTKQENYKQYIFNNLPKLEILDRYDREGNEQVEEQEFEDDQDDDDQGDYDDDEQDDDEEFDDQEEESPQPKKKR